MYFLTRSVLFAGLLFLASCSSDTSIDSPPSDGLSNDPDMADIAIANPNTPDPEVSDPNVPDPGVSDPNVPDPGVSDPNVPDPGVSDPNVPDPEVSDPNVPDPEVSDPNALDLPVADATSIIDGDNYIDILSLAARTTLRYDHAEMIRDVINLEAEGSVDIVAADGTYTTNRNCPLGGTVVDTGQRSFDGFGYSQSVRTYALCATHAGTLHGSVVNDWDSDTQYVEYDVTLTGYAESQSPLLLPDANTIELNATFYYPYELVRQVDLRQYNETSNSQTLELTGSTGWHADGSTLEENGYYFDGVMLLETSDGGGALSINIVASGMNTDASTVLENGSLSVTASDGSSVAMIPGDTAGTVNITRVNSNGSEFPETLPWSDIYP